MSLFPLEEGRAEGIPIARSAMANTVTSRLYLLVIAILAVLAWLGGNATSPAGEPQSDSLHTRPNIILILADDMGFSDLGCYGSEINTPNIDRLGFAGLRFTQFYNASRCCPTRASLLTGLYPHQAGIGHMVGRSPNGLYNGDLSHNAITLAEGLKTAGYATYMTGKWHVTPYRPNSPSLAQNGPTGRGFDRFYGIIQSIRSHYNPPSLMEDGRPLPPTEGDYHFTDAVSEHAVAYIKDQPADKPYFLYVAYAAPHFPLHAREADIARYRGRFQAGWDELRKERHQRLVDLKLIDPAWPLPERDEQELPWDEINPAYRDWFDGRMAVYAAMIEQMDRGVGTILDAVAARADRDNTIVLFLSDNGGCAEEIAQTGNAANDYPRRTRSGAPVRVGNVPTIMPGPEDTYASYGLEWASLSNAPFRRFKSFVHEGGIATPCIVWWPNKIQPAITHEQAHVIDLLPTLLDLAQASYPAEYQGHRIQPVEGRSLLPVLAGGTRPPAVFGWEHEGNRALRRGDWKIVSRYPNAWELYNMKSDRLESHDLAKELPDKTAELTALYNTWADRTGVKPWTGRQTPIGWDDNSKYKK